MFNVIYYSNEKLKKNLKEWESIMLAYDIAIMTVDVLSALIKSYNQNKISFKMLKEHTELKLVFLKDVRNDINDADLLKEIDNIIQEVEM